MSQRSKVNIRAQIGKCIWNVMLFLQSSKDLTCIWNLLIRKSQMPFLINLGQRSKVMAGTLKINNFLKGRVFALIFMKVRRIMYFWIKQTTSSPGHYIQIFPLNLCVDYIIFISGFVCASFHKLGSKVKGQGQTCNENIMEKLRFQHIDKTWHDSCLVKGKSFLNHNQSEAGEASVALLYNLLIFSVTNRQTQKCPLVCPCVHVWVCDDSL